METYKRIVLVFRATVIGAAMYALVVLGADPVPTLTIMAALALGPDVVESYLTRGE